MPFFIGYVAGNNGDGYCHVEYNECQPIDGIDGCCLRQQDFTVMLYDEARRIILPSYDENTEAKALLLKVL